MITIIIPIYNAQEYLSCALSSIKKQKLKERIKVIIIDDASTQSYDNILNKYQDLDIKYVKLKINKGPGNARNIGLKYVDTKYILFLDSDDELINISPLIDTIDNRKIMIGLESIDGINGIHFGNLHGKLYLKSIIGKYKIKFPNIYYGEDTVFNIKYMLSINNEDIKIINSLTYKYNKIDNSLSSKDVSIDTFKEILKYSKKYIKKTNNLEYKIIMKEHLIKTIMNYYKKGKLLVDKETLNNKLIKGIEKL